jgi:hypothetical protein
MAASANFPPGGILGRDRPPLAALGLLATLLLPRPAAAQSCDASLPTGSISGVVNTYYPGRLTVGAGTATPTLITIDGAAIRGAAATLAAGDMLIVMQMQDAQINEGGTATSPGTADYGDGPGGLTVAGYTALNNTGVYEYAVAETGLFTGGICPSGSTCITIRGAGAGDGLLFTYTTAARIGTGGAQRNDLSVSKAGPLRAPGGDEVAAQRDDGATDAGIRIRDSNSAGGRIDEERCEHAMHHRS